MTRNQLVEIANFLTKYKKINTIYRVEDTILKVEFGKDEAIFFDLKKGDSHAFLKDSFKVLKHYSAPFDIVLKKRFSNALIEKVEVEDGNRILKFYTKKSSGYKEHKTILQLEFTGRNTNAIITDENKTILEALRHIDSFTSTREVKVGVTLKDIPPREFKSKDEKIEDIEEFLKQEYLKREEIKLKVIKTQKVSQVAKKISKFESLLKKIPTPKELETKMLKAYSDADIVMANLQNIKSYEKEFKLKNFEGEEVLITLPKEAKSATHASELLYKMAKKLKQKLKNSHIEKENLISKIEFYESLKDMIENAKSLDEINLYLPKAKQNEKRKKIDSNIETFFYQDHKILVGKNQKGNIKLLKEANASDFWLHVKDIPSSHVIIKNSKKSLNLDIIEFGAKLCVNLTKLNKGNYLVDYTQRRNVKLRDGANVNYVDYKTIGVLKD